MSDCGTGLTTDQKCAEILRRIIALCNDNVDFEAGGVLVIGFGPDWGQNSLTVYLKGNHSHVGQISDPSPFEELVSQMYDLLLNGRGLSWA